MNLTFPVSQVPEYTRAVARELIKNNYEAYLVGGAVRDLILKREVKDFDIATNAKPDEIIDLFPKAIATGARFGNIIVISKDEKGESFDVDVTTYRSEENYFGGRWPGKVEFTKTIEEDLERRDFKMNAIAIDFNQILTDDDQLLERDQITDPFNGFEDIKTKIISAVGDPLERFREDGLRAFRACRFASELGFKIDKETKEAVKAAKNIATMISMERIRDELTKILYNSPKPSVGIRLLDELDLLKYVIPELEKAKNVIQPEWHSEDVFDHSLKTLDIAEDRVKLAALLHDIGKPDTKTEDEKGIHFYGHDVKGAEIARKIMKRLKFSNEEIGRTTNLIRWHMFYYPSAEWRKDNNLSEIDIDEKETRRNAFKHGWTDSAIRRFIKNVGGPDQLDDLIRLRVADANANKKSSFDPKEIEALEVRVAKVLEQDMALKVTDLDINGKDLISIGVKKGPQLGIILNKLLDHVLDQPELNEKSTLLELAKQSMIN